MEFNKCMKRKLPLSIRHKSNDKYQRKGIRYGLNANKYFFMCIYVADKVESGRPVHAKVLATSVSRDQVYISRYIIIYSAVALDSDSQSKLFCKVVDASATSVRVSIKFILHGAPSESLEVHGIVALLCPPI